MISFHRHEGAAASTTINNNKKEAHSYLHNFRSKTVMKKKKTSALLVAILTLLVLSITSQLRSMLSIEDGLTLKSSTGHEVEVLLMEEDLLNMNAKNSSTGHAVPPTTNNDIILLNETTSLNDDHAFRNKEHTKLEQDEPKHDHYEPDDKTSTTSRILNITQNQNSTIPSNGKSKINKKPILYMHVGPPKTATTTIEDKLTQYRDELLDDGIVFLGKDNHENWLNYFPHPAYCIIYKQYQEINQGISPHCFETMNQTLREYHRDGKDIVFSDEVVGLMFSATGRHQERSLESLKLFASILQDWDVRVLIGYRPYFDFITSEFNEQWEIKPSKAKMNKWPKHGGLTVPLVKDSFNRNGYVQRGWPAADAMADVFAREFDNIAVFDITQSGDLMTYFLCNLLENAHQTCEAQKTFVASGTPETKKNVASPLDYDMLATAASERSLFDLTLKRAKVANMIKEHHEKELGLKVQDFPLICPLEERTEKLFEVSLAQEKRLFPDRVKEEVHEKLRAAFEKRMDQKRLCNIDVDKVLEDESWIQFFKSL